MWLVHYEVDDCRSELICTGYPFNFYDLLLASPFNKNKKFHHFYVARPFLQIFTFFLNQQLFIFPKQERASIRIKLFP